MSLENVKTQLETFALSMDRECKKNEYSLVSGRDQLKFLEPEIIQIEETICRYELEAE
mgnify:CR=1 FL=1